MASFFKLLLHYLRIGLFTIPVGIVYGLWVVNFGDSWTALVLFGSLGLILAHRLEGIYTKP